MKTKLDYTVETHDNRAVSMNSIIVEYMPAPEGATNSPTCTDEIVLEFRELKLSSKTYPGTQGLRKSKGSNSVMVQPYRDSASRDPSCKSKEFDRARRALGHAQK